MGRIQQRKAANWCSHSRSGKQIGRIAAIKRIKSERNLDSEEKN